jgi:CDP-glucose 4,6-dehydratase
MDLSFYKNKRVFITGHTGFKGSWLCKILVLAGAKVTGYALEPNTKPSMFELLNIDKNIASIIGDVRDYDHLYEAIKKAKPEIVFHLAAQPIVRESYNNPRYTYESNVMGTVNLLEAIRNTKGIKSVVNITTDKVYLNKEWCWGYREDEELCGYDPYSNSKSCSELVTYSYNKSFFDSDNSISVSTARSGNVIGGGDFAKDRIIPDCVRSAINNEDIIVRNPYSIRPYQHVLDCLYGYLLLAKSQYNNKDISGSYNFGPNEESMITTGDLASLFCEKWQSIKWINKSDHGPHEANFLKLDCSKAKKVLHFEPKIPIEKAIELVVEWHKAYINKKDLNKITDKQILNYFNGGKR